MIEYGWGYEKVMRQRFGLKKMVENKIYFFENFYLYLLRC